MKYIPNSFQLPNAVVDELMCQVSSTAFKCYIVIARKTLGWHKDSDYIALSQLIKLIGMSERQIRRAMTELEEKDLIIMDKQRGSLTNYQLRTQETVPTDADDRNSADADGRLQNPPTKPTKQNTIVEKVSTEVNQVIDLLNELTESKYKTTTKSHIENINARLKDGYSLQDLLSVVTHKVQKWLHEPEMSQYLRPSTLFSVGKFPGYLIAAKNSGTVINYRGNFQDRDYGETGKIS